jgi:segregation and condensation protein B
LRSSSRTVEQKSRKAEKQKSRKAEEQKSRKAEESRELNSDKNRELRGNAGSRLADERSGAEEQSGIDGPLSETAGQERESDSDGLFSTVADEGPPELVKELEYERRPGAKKDKEEDVFAELTLTTIDEARAVLEGFLFTSNEPLSVQRLSKLMNNLHPRTVRGLLLELQMQYESRPGALQVLEIAGGFQLATRPHLADWMFRMHRHKRRSALSPATLETLAIVAYKQPITRGEIEAIRGVDSSGTVRTLQDLYMIEASGHREVVGRPQLFVTTDQFLKAFGLKSLADLPSISELRNLFSTEQKLQPSIVAPSDLQANEEKSEVDTTNNSDDEERAWIEKPEPVDPASET